MLTIKTIKTIKTKFSSSKIIKNAGLNLLTQFLSYLLTFISIPILLKFLGKESFGIFQTILTVLGWVSIANLGLGNGLRNKITENYTHLEKINNVKTLIGSAFSFSAIISATIALFSESTNSGHKSLYEITVGFIADACIAIFLNKAAALSFTDSSQVADNNTPTLPVA